MTKDVVVIASGETERRSLPHLVAHLREEGIAVVDVRIPPGTKALNVNMAEKLIYRCHFPRDCKKTKPTNDCPTKYQLPEVS